MSLPAYFKHIGLAILFVLATVNFTKTTINVIESSKRLDETKEEVAGLQSEKSELEEDLNYKESDEYIEKEARNKLGLVKPGEEVFVVSQVLGETSAVGTASANGEDLSNLQLWFDLFL